MNKEWSEQNKKMQDLIKKRDTFDEGISSLVVLRDQLYDTICSFREDLSKEDFSAIPFINSDGYHSKTIAYSLWHIFRIEDIVAHTLIKGDDQVFFEQGYQKRTGSPIITTGNELVKQEISDFSEKLDLDELYSYIADVRSSTEDILRSMSFEDLKKKISGERREALTSLNVVSTDESAIWLIDYWCNKDIRGLIQMPFSRHWIMHIEACLRIKKKLARQ
ncbi:MAG: DinB family protein [Clostridiales bacterium]|nr:DinB family protein [Clostridiales bacterium]